MQWAKDEPLFSVSTDKVEMDVESAVGGLLGEILVGPGETVRVGTVVAYIVERTKMLPPRRTPRQATARGKVPGQDSTACEQSAYRHRKRTGKFAGTAAPASPRAKRLAKESNIDLSSVNGSGPDGQRFQDD